MTAKPTTIRILIGDDRTMYREALRSVLGRQRGRHPPAIDVPQGHRRLRPLERPAAEEQYPILSSCFERGQTRAALYGFFNAAPMLK